MKYLLLICLVAFAVTSCKKDASVEAVKKNNTAPNFMEEGPYDSDGSVSMVFDNYINGGDANEDMRAFVGAGFRNSGVLVSLGDVNVNDHNIDYQSGTLAYDKVINYSDISDEYGANITYAAAGTATFAGFSKSFYLPSIIEVTSPSITGNGSIIDKSEDLEFSWNADANNLNKVVIGITYEGGMSNNEDPNLSSTSTTFYEIVDDDGSYTIPASELSDLPEGGYVTIRVGRGHHQEYTLTDGKEVMLSGLTIANALVKVVP